MSSKVLYKRISGLRDHIPRGRILEPESLRVFMSEAWQIIILSDTFARVPLNAYSSTRIALPNVQRFTHVQGTAPGSTAKLLVDVVHHVNIGGITIKKREKGDTVHTSTVTPSQKEIALRKECVTAIWYNLIVAIVTVWYACHLAWCKSYKTKRFIPTWPVWVLAFLSLKPSRGRLPFHIANSRVSDGRRWDTAFCLRRQHQTAWFLRH